MNYSSTHHKTSSIEQIEEQKELNQESHFSNGKSSSTVPKLLVTDRVYHPRNGVFVIPEYKLIFMGIPKVASSEWKRLFMRMIKNPDWCTYKMNIHNPESHTIQYLENFPLDVANTMMTSAEWTRAVFLREPKERLLSAFLNKVKSIDYFVRKCCNRIDDLEKYNKCMHCRRFEPGSKERKECYWSPREFEYFLKVITDYYPKVCHDVHWEAQADKIDAKWWPFFNFIGYHSSLHEDAKRLLQSLFSNEDEVRGRSAWDRYGATGWGDREGCENRTFSFLEVNSSPHDRDANKQMKEWYTTETEKFVEKHWSQDWNIDGVTFRDVKLFEDHTS